MLKVLAISNYLLSSYISQPQPPHKDFRYFPVLYCTTIRLLIQRFYAKNRVILSKRRGYSHELSNVTAHDL